MRSIVPALLAIAVSTTGSLAQEWQSHYTDIALEECTLLSTYELGATWACPGYKGYPLMIMEGDLRFFVSYGFGAPDEMAARQSFPQFNTIGERLEWLTEEHVERGSMPQATILRYYLEPFEMDDPIDQVLVVAKIEPGNTCRVAQVDALRNQDANSLAREAAVKFVPGWDCETMTPQTIGQWGVEGL